MVDRTSERESFTSRTDGNIQIPKSARIRSQLTSLVQVRNAHRDLPNPRRIVVIILNLNRAEETVTCVESVLKSTYTDVSTLVIDNGSENANLCALENGLDERVDLAALTENIGVAAAWNLGIAYAVGRYDCEFVLLLNNDAIVDSSVIEELVAAAETHPEAGAFGPSIRDHRYESPTGVDELNQSGATVVDHELTGCALMIRLKVLEEIGMFDEDYFVYGEEMDLLHRMREMRWASLRVVTKGEVHHEGSLTASMMTGFEAYHRSRNALLFAGKNLRGRPLVHYLRNYCLNYQPWGVQRDLDSDVPAEALVARIRGTASGILLLIRYVVAPEDLRRCYPRMPNRLLDE